MSRKERQDAMKALLAMIRKHEGEWTVEKLISEFSIRYGYTRKKVDEYLGELIIAGLVTVGENSAYIKEQKTAEKEVPKE